MSTAFPGIFTPRAAAPRLAAARATRPLLLSATAFSTRLTRTSKECLLGMVSVPRGGVSACAREDIHRAHSRRQIAPLQDALGGRFPSLTAPSLRLSRLGYHGFAPGPKSARTSAHDELVIRRSVERTGIDILTRLELDRVALGFA